MSFTDPSAEPAQTPEVQGEEASGGGSPWESYLTRIPEDARDIAAEAFREMEANATKKFQEHSEFRKQWEPLQDTGVSQRSPEEVSWAMQFLDAMQDPKNIQQWYENVFAPENGLTPAQAQEAEAALDDFGFQDPSQQFEKLLEDRLGPIAQQLEQYASRFQQQDEAQEMAKAQSFINSEVAAIEKEHGALDDEQKQLLATLAGRYSETDHEHCIQRAWADMQRWQNSWEKKALQAKVDQPPPAESGGVPDVAPPEHKRINDPSVMEAARAFLRNENRA